MHSKELLQYMLGDNAKQIFASTYQFHLPSEKELEAELQRELLQFKYGKNSPISSTG